MVTEEQLLPMLYFPLDSLVLYTIPWNVDIATGKESVFHTNWDQVAIELRGRSLELGINLSGRKIVLCLLYQSWDSYQLQACLYISIEIIKIWIVKSDHGEQETIQLEGEGESISFTLDTSAMFK